MQEVSLERLHPPEKPKVNLDSMPKDYWDWCNNLDTKRSWMLARFGKSHRGSTEALKQKVVQQNKELEIGKEINSLVRGSRADYREVMKELKAKLASRKEVVETDE